MPLPDEYLIYPHRRHGMDHDFYPWSALPDRPAVQWPGGAGLALWVNVVLEHFPLDTGKTPFPVPGGLERPYPDFWNYTLRDYGNRVGCYRLFRMLDGCGVRASVAMNSALAVRLPYLVAEVRRRGYEIIAHGLDMAHLHAGGLDEATEAGWIDRCLAEFEAATGSRPRGWLSPGQSQGRNTLRLLAGRGVDYCCDWSNDELPYAFAGAAEGLVSMPYPHELSDFTCLHLWAQTADEFAEQIVDAAHNLRREAAAGKGGRLLAVTLHASIGGQPHRVPAIRRALETVMALPGVWSAQPGEILDAWRRG